LRVLNKLFFLICLEKRTFSNSLIRNTEGYDYEVKKKKKIDPSQIEKKSENTDKNDFGRNLKFSDSDFHGKIDLS
jgi:hypothetical protein